MSAAFVHFSILSSTFESFPVDDADLRDVAIAGVTDNGYVFGESREENPLRLPIWLIDGWERSEP